MSVYFLIFNLLSFCYVFFFQCKIIKTQLDSCCLLFMHFTGYSIGSKAGSIVGPSVYLDLAYLPSGHAAATIDVEFFSRLRSSCYIISGDDTLKDTILKPILDAILEGKSVWPDDVPVS